MFKLSLATQDVLLFHRNFRTDFSISLKMTLGFDRYCIQSTHPYLTMLIWGNFLFIYLFIYLFMELGIKLRVAHVESKQSST
jgi:hypothetical protein